MEGRLHSIDNLKHRKARVKSLRTRATIVALAALFSTAILASPAAAEVDQSSALPSGAYIVQEDGVEIVRASQTLSVADLAAIGATQTPEEIAATIALIDADQPGQVLLDFESDRRDPAAAVLLPAQDAQFGTMAVFQCSPSTTSSKATTSHNTGTATRRWCGTGEAYPNIPGLTSVRNNIATNVLVGPNNLSWQACPGYAVCSVTPVITLGYISFN